MSNEKLDEKKLNEGGYINIKINVGTYSLEGLDICRALKIWSTKQNSEAVYPCFL